jgi:molybdopterin converting factor small subunit
MKVRVAFYGRLSEVAGASEADVEVDGPAPTLADLADRLRDRHPDLAEHLDAAAFAVGDELAEPDRPLRDGEEVGVLPPVSGG